MIQVKPELVINHLRRARSFPYAGETRFRILYNDMIKVGTEMNFTVIPETARDPKSIKQFSIRETYEDLKLNSKYRHRNTTAIQLSIEKIKAL